jgi:3-hydroxy-3-methylglutaryl CoA synthase
MSPEVGILAAGAYIPRLRLQRKAIAAANAWFNPGLRGLARGERAMANWDEDAVTMAVEAARDCLTGSDPETVAALYLASTTHPFDDRQSTSIVAGALNLRADLRTLDIGGSLRAGTSSTGRPARRARRRCTMATAPRRSSSAPAVPSRPS